MTPNKKKYNLTLMQWIFSVPGMYFTWLTYDKNKRVESFHIVLKRMEKHEHKFTIPYTETYKGKTFRMWKCEHEGCNIINDNDFEESLKTK